MSNKFRICLTALLVILITGSWGSVAKAISPNVELEGNARGIVFLSGDEPFLMKYNMLPGDTVERKMKLVNRYSDTYKIYLRAQRLTPKEKADILSKIHLKVFYDKKEIYSGPVSGEDGMTKNIYLGSIDPGKEKELYAKAILDGRTMGNEFKNKYGEVEWIFTAVRIPKSKAYEQEEFFKKYVPEKIFNREIMPKTGSELAGYIPYIAIGAILLGLLVLSYNRKNKKSLKKDN
ncbi:LPXTG cell wall anchor domain-containing protein [Clostridium sp.]|uniref:LPXTG cell wall anchor domain-containing protein n=1 Tax=Clostridium sp. TaxID=1506 RepID=UPI0026051BC0|nr:LPXTG cell wall anchor domain-containing protein [Clostridium sp.]